MACLKGGCFHKLRVIAIPAWAPFCSEALGRGSFQPAGEDASATDLPFTRVWLATTLEFSCGCSWWLTNKPGNRARERSR